MTAAGVYRRLIALFRRGAWRLLILALPVFVPVGLLKAIPITIEASEVSLVEGIALLAAYLVDVSLTFVGVIFYSGAVAALAAEEVVWEQRSLAALVRRLPYARLAAIDVIVTVATGIGLLLLVVPGLVAVIWLSLAAPLAEIERRGVRSALARSRHLAQSRFWLVARVILPIWLVVVVLAEAVEEAAHALLGSGLAVDWLAATAGLIVATPYALGTAVLALELSHRRPATDASG